MTVMVGTEAPDFRAEAYHRGKVGEIRLSQYRGRWLVLFFYPADFTCV
jgi:peroxiredoxin (alkyl hydroperoxide reductase subunit C)